VVVTLVLEPAFDAHTWAATALNYLAWASFAVDYAIRLRLAEDRWRSVRRHPLDLAAVALPMVRSLRLVASIARVAALSQRGLAERVIATTVLIASTVLLAGAWSAWKPSGTRQARTSPHSATPCGGRLDEPATSRAPRCPLGSSDREQERNQRVGILHVIKITRRGRKQAGAVATSSWPARQPSPTGRSSGGVGWRCRAVRT
jgi:hypothetical protein